MVNYKYTSGNAMEKNVISSVTCLTQLTPVKWFSSNMINKRNLPYYQHLCDLLHLRSLSSAYFITRILSLEEFNR